MPIIVVEGYKIVGRQAAMNKEVSFYPWADSYASGTEAIQTDPTAYEQEAYSGVATFEEKRVVLCTQISERKRKNMWGLIVGLTRWAWFRYG